MKALFLTILFLLISSCATTKISVFKDPAFASNRYASVLVLAYFQNLELRDFTESVSCEEFSKIAIRCKRGIDVFLPTRTYSDQEWGNAFRASNMEALISIELQDKYSDQAYIPQTSTTSGTVSSIGNTAYYSGSTSTSGGYYVSKPVEIHEIKLLDAKSGKTVLVATGTSKGGAGVDSKMLATSLAKKLVQTLTSQDVLLVSEEVLLDAKQKAAGPEARGSDGWKPVGE